MNYYLKNIIILSLILFIGCSRLPWKKSDANSENINQSKEELLDERCHYEASYPELPTEEGCYVFSITEKKYLEYEMAIGRYGLTTTTTQQLMQKLGWAFFINALKSLSEAPEYNRYFE